MDYKFSVLMSVYKNDNSEYFSIALDSVINQTLVPNEIVIVVDGEIPETTEKVIEEKKEKYSNFNIVRLSKNQGQSIALNEGLKNCTYNLVARMDADDISDSERFEKQINVFKEDNSVVVTSGYTVDISSNGDNYGIRKVPLSFDEVKKYFKRRSPVNHGACMYKKDFILKVGGYKDFKQTQDYILWGDVLKSSGLIKNIPEVLLKVRVDDNYSRKRTLLYIKEELKTQKYFYSIGMLGKKDLVINFFCRVLVRLVSSKLLFIIYKKFLRG